MNLITDSAASAVKSTATPWIIAAFLFAVIASGGVGAYFGYGYADGQAAKDKEQLVTAYNTALNEREARRKDAEARSHTVEAEFLTGLNNIKVENKTYNVEVQKETEKLIYTDCKLPDSGVDLLNRHIDAVNLQLIGVKEKK